MRVSDFSFDLPDELIAQEAAPRGESRLLALHRASGAIRHLHMSDLPALLRPGDVLVVNDTRVFARGCSAAACRAAARSSACCSARRSSGDPTARPASKRWSIPGRS